MSPVEALLVAIAGFLGGFVSTLASNGSSVTLPTLEFLGLPEHAANGTNRLSVVALGLVATISFWRKGLIDWRSGARIAVTIALGALAGSFIAVELSDAVLDAVVIAGLLVVLLLLLLHPSRWLGEREVTLRPFERRQAAAYFAIGLYAGLVVLGSGFFMLAALVLLTGCELREANAMKALILLIVGAQSLFIFGESGDVDWAAGVPLALGSGVGACLAARLATRTWAKVWVYRFLVLTVILSILYLLTTDSTEFLQHA